MLFSSLRRQFVNLMLSCLRIFLSSLSGLRALSQSTAREFSQHGIHACNVRLDCVLDTPKYKVRTTLCIFICFIYIFLKMNDVCVSASFFLFTFEYMAWRRGFVHKRVYAVVIYWHLVIRPSNPCALHAVACSLHGVLAICFHVLTIQVLAPPFFFFFFF